MKTRLNLIHAWLLCGVLLPTAAGFAQTNQYFYTGSETNITLPPGTYIITAYGAQGGNGHIGGGGLGAGMSGKFDFSATTTLTLLVGGSGGSNGGGSGGGGGGSFVVNGATPLVVAGGGGGGGYSAGSGSGSGGLPGVTNVNGTIGNGPFSGVGGTNGSGGYASTYGTTGAGGGGFYSNGGDGSSGAGGGVSFLGGGMGGTAGSPSGAAGGYGGGGGSLFYGGGGGGGYSGGGGNEAAAGAGGGGSIIDSSATQIIAELSGVQSGNGEIDIVTVATGASPPALGITTVSNMPVVLWPASATNGVLQMTTNLSSGDWATVSNGVPFSGVQITNASANAFFRWQQN